MFQSPKRHPVRVPPMESPSELRWRIWSLSTFAPLCGECFGTSQIPTFQPRSIAARLSPSQVQNLRFNLPNRIGRCSSDCREQAARKRRRRMRHIRHSTHALMEGSDLSGTEKCQRKETVGWRIPSSDDDAPRVRSRDDHRRYGHTPDRIEMLRISRLNRRSIRRNRRFAAAQLIDRSAARTIGAAARRCRTRHR